MSDKLDLTLDEYIQRSGLTPEEIQHKEAEVSRMTVDELVNCIVSGGLLTDDKNDSGNTDQNL